MASPESTRWTVIRAAAEGEDAAQSEFVERYGPVILACLRARWQGSPLLSEVDDVAQEVFLDCFKQNGVLARVDSDRPAGFRAFLFGVIRKAALLHERKHVRRRAKPGAEPLDLDRVPSGDYGLSTVFDRAWATAILKEAGDRQEERARERGEDALRRVELLDLRFGDGLPIREIARLWEEDAARLHHEYAKARREFRDALHEVVAFHHPGSREQVERECSRLLSFFD